MTKNDWFPDSSLDTDARSLDEEANAPHPDELFRALNDRTRRRLLYLLSHNSSLSIETLVEMLCSSRRPGDDDPSGGDQLSTSLEHVHLPLLADVGLVTYDHVDGEVRLKTLATPVEELIQFASTYEDAYREHRQ